jgi:hypothetical protein
MCAGFGLLGLVGDDPRRPTKAKEGQTQHHKSGSVDCPALFDMTGCPAVGFAKDDHRGLTLQPDLLRTTKPAVPAAAAAAAAVTDYEQQQWRQHQHQHQPHQWWQQHETTTPRSSNGGGIGCRSSSSSSSSSSTVANIQSPVSLVHTLFHTNPCRL